MPNYDVVYNKEDYLRHMAQLTPADYSFHNRDGYFYKEETDRLLKIFISSSLYFPDSARYGGAAIIITFYDVETLFSEVLRHFPLKGYEYREYYRTCETAFLTKQDYGETIFNFLADKDVETDADFQEVKPHLQQAIDHCLAFSDQYKTHTDLYLAFKDLPGSERRKVISQPLPHKWAIILKLNNDSGYENYINSLIDYYTNDRPEPLEVDFFNALKERLSQL
ncbi:hypothetical protein [Luteirhabdus pelagi]|uniref:hypothetical protein n=1 Tax=Luteirhabdus pelagi TaxID=2792783 RepID=UPI001939C2D4|nr:hypothetical protein [Luteirhabdus pelagi]